MLTVKPIQSKAEQELLCAKCKIPFDANLFAYAAHVDDAFVGICQFAIKGETGYIKNIVSLEGVDDFEAMFILGRGTLNFIDLCGVHEAECEKDAGEKRLITALGFKDVGKDTLYLDMNGLFEGKCSDHK